MYFHSTQTKKCTVLFLGYLCYTVTLNIATYFDPKGIIIRELTKATLQKTKLTTFVRSRDDVKESNT
jgi:hypothetical protein